MGKSSGIKKKLIRLLCIALVLCLTFLLTPYSHADELTDAKQGLKDVNQEIDSKAAQLKAGKAKVSALTAEINALENKIYQTQAEINQLSFEINDTKAQIRVILNDLNYKLEELNQQSDDLNARLRNMYKNGNAGMLSVLLGSTTLSDVMTSMDMIQRIYESDAQLLIDLEQQYDEIDESKASLLVLKTQLLDQQKEQENKRISLTQDQNSANEKRKQVKENNEELEKQIDALNEEANALTAQILLLQSKDEYIGGTMLWPAEASKTITSKFGNRLHPILKVNKMHAGIDIGARSGTNILAANAGKVISAGWNNSYGYMVMIDHGGGIVTLYAHSSKLLVQKGDIVKRGQVIALVGSTGMSTGPHLHFEVRVDGVYKNPLDYVK